MDCDDDSFGYFPQLPRLRNRKNYVADRSHSSVCNKKSSRHPSLLPGIFTLYCEHGISFLLYSIAILYVYVAVYMIRLVLNTILCTNALMMHYNYVQASIVIPHVYSLLRGMLWTSHFASACRNLQTFHLLYCLNISLQV